MSYQFERIVMFAVLACLAGPAWSVSYSSHTLAMNGSSYGEARALNSAGQIAGWLDCPKTAVTWNGTGPASAVVPQYDESLAYGINDSGQIVGIWTDDLGWDHTYLWTPGVGDIDLGTLPLTISKMNNRAQIVGFYYQTESPATAFIWNADIGFTDLDGLTAMTSVAYDINNNGLVVGTASTSYQDYYAFSWSQDSGLTVLAQQAEARAVNDQGEIVGITDSGVNMFLLSTGHEMRTVITPNGYDWIAPTAIDSSGAVVGNLFRAGAGDAFLWNSGTGFTILGEGTAFDINDSGQIVGRLMDQPVLWEPVPEPSSLLALGGGILAVAGIIRRRR